MGFKHPLFFLMLIPLVIVLMRNYIDMHKYFRYASKIIIPWKKLWSNDSREKSGLSPRMWSQLGYALSAVFFIIALARPQSAFQTLKRNIDGIDIVIVLDLSASMRIEDFRNKNRMEVAKPIIQEFIEWRKNDRIGLQVFSGEAATLTPPTLDHEIVLRGLEEANIGDLKDGTAIGDALATAISRLKESRAKSKVIVLVTDGDSNVGSVDPLTAGELAKGYGIKIYSIAIGRDGRVAMPFVQKDVFGRQIKTYQYFDSSINTEIPRQISEMTGGKLYRIQDSTEELKNAFAEIDRLEKTSVETKEQIRYEENYKNILLVGLLIFLATFILQHTVLRVYP